MSVPLAFCSRHWFQLTSMRLVPSHSGKAELKRPPGEGTGMPLTVCVSTSFEVVDCWANVMVG